MLTVHHLVSSQSERIVWLCEELGIPYTLERYGRDPSGAASAEYKALHPAATAPIITDGALVLPESGAIVEYIVRRHGGGRLIPDADDPAFAEFLFWFHYANGSIVPALMMDMVAARHGGSPGPRADRAFRLVERRLGEASWFAGDAFTAADIMMMYPLTRAHAVAGRDPGDLPNMTAYLARVRQRPAFRAAMAKAEPDRPLD